MCDIPPEDRAKLEEIAATTSDRLLSNALVLILRGAYLPQPVVQRLLNAGAALLDAHDAAMRFTNRKDSSSRETRESSDDDPRADPESRDVR